MPALPRIGTLALAALCVTAMLAGLPAARAQDDKVATVNGKDVPKMRLDLLVRERTQQGVPDSPQLRDAVKNDLISRELVVQEAERRGVTKSAEVREQIELAKQTVVLRAFLTEWQKNNAASEDAIKAEYEQLKAQTPGTEYRARHILVESEAEAKDLIAKLKKGGKFEELAKASKDPGSKDKGGDLGWASSQTYVKPFADALQKLDKGKLTDDPVQSQFGWHVIKLEDSRPVKHPPLDQVKAQLEQRVQQQMLQKMIADLRAKAKIQ